MRILRVTTFRWGDSVNNWYSDLEAVRRQLQAEAGRVRSKDVINEEWFECSAIERPDKPLVTLDEMVRKPDVKDWREQ